MSVMLARGVGVSFAATCSPRSNVEAYAEENKIVGGEYSKSVVLCG